MVMRTIKYLIPVWIAVILYVLLSIWTGPRGLSSYDQLASERDRLQANMKSLQNINRELENTKNALMYDEKAIALYARDLGYGAENEGFIRIVGLGDIKKQRTDAGELIHPAKPDHIPDISIKIFCCCIGLAIFLCIWVPDFLNSNRRHPFPKFWE
jgi:cell division protein FtsB